MLLYVGAGQNPLRSIPAPFVDDPDWTDPSVPEPDGACWRMENPIPGAAVLTFAFFDTNGVEVPGGTADGDEFYVTSRQAFGLGNGRAVVRKGETETEMDLSEGWIMTMVGPQPHGLRLRNIAAPAGAVRLQISVGAKPE